MTADDREAPPSGSARTGPRLGLFLNMPAHAVDAELTARYPHLFDFFLVLAGRTRETWLALPLRRGGTRRPEYGAVQLPDNLHILGLPHWSSAPMLVRRIGLVLPAAVWGLIRHVRHWDVVGAVVPSVIGNLFIAASRVSGRPVFLLVRGEKQRTISLIFDKRRSKRWFIWALRLMELPVRRWIGKGVPAFVAGEELVTRYGGPGANVYNLYPGLGSDFDLATAPRPPRVEDDAPLRLITVSRLSPEKGIDELLKALDLLRSRSVRATAIIVGDGPDRERLESIAASLDLDGSVEFRGFVPHGPELVRALDEAEVFVLPSKSEGMPHSLVEAMARALPVITSTIGGMRALLADGTGLLVAPGDPSELAAAIADLAGDPVQRAALSARSLEKARGFTSERVLEEFCARLADAYPRLGFGGSAMPSGVRTFVRN